MQPERSHRTIRRRWLWPVASYTIAAVCLYFVFRDINFHELLQTAAKIRWGWIPIAVVLDLLAYVCIACQWKLVLRPVGTLPVRKLAQAIFAGRFANDVLPVHVGYVIRIYLVSHWMGAEIAKVIPSLLVERLAEALCLAVAIAFTACFLSLPTEVVRTGEVLGGVFAAGSVLVVLMVRRKRRRFEPGAERSWLKRELLKLIQFVERLADGVRSIGTSRLLPLMLGMTSLKLLIQGLAFTSILWAYHFDLSFGVTVAVFLIATVGMSLPSTPASAGVFQLFCVAGLTLFGISKVAATGFALLAFVVLTLPLALTGFFALAQSGMTLRDVRTKAGEWKTAVEGAR